MEKTISHLNSKIWYRILKVLYILSFLVVLLITIVIIYSVNFPAQQVVDNDETTILCNYGNKKQFLASENNVYFSYSELSSDNYLTDYHKTELKKLCQISKTELDQKLNAILSKTDDNTKLFDINPVIKNEGGIIAFLGYSILGILILIIIFEIIKRIFYYILLGSLNPKK